MAERWVVGDTPHLETSFYNGDTLTDPTTVTLTVTTPAGVATSYTFAGGTVTKASTGIYYRNVAVSEAGKWSYQWTATGAVADVATGTFTVHPAALDALDVLTSDEARDILKIGSLDQTQAARLASAVTAVSRRLDDEYGPIVKRTIAAKTYEPSCWDLWVDGPIYSTPALTITEYNTSGAGQLLTLETYDTKPAHGYRLEARSGLGGGYTGRIRRTAGTSQQTWGTVRITYVAGRFSDTGTVDPVFKEAASHLLEAQWEQVRPHTDSNDDDLPVFVIPREVMDEAMAVIPVNELRPRRVLT